MLKIGEYEVSVLQCENFALDGGAMFGSVPKALWSRSIVPDEQNRIPLTCRILVLKKGSQVILVDVGCGDKWSEKERKIYAIEALGATPLSERVSGVTDIILTHLHFDHGGGISRYNENNELELTFPGANIFLQEANWENAQNPNVREKASYLKEHVVPLASAKLNLVQNAAEVLPGITVHRVDGHTHGLQWVLVKGEKQSLAFPADLVPTAHHLPLPYLMGYDMCAERGLREKDNFLQKAVKEKWILVFEHDHSTPAATIGVDASGRYVIDKHVDIPSL